ncbi:MAG: Lar family restriction alleviation protein [Acutalibacteraceae bacterium]
MLEIKPCLCGGTGELIKLFPKNRYDCFVRCDRCGYETKAYTSKQNAVKAWNRRAENENNGKS